MKKILSCILVIVLLASLVPMSVMPASAQGIVVPGDKDGDKIVSRAELASVILPYMLGEPGHLQLNEIREIAHIHVYYPRSIVDTAGRTVKIYKPVKKIVVLNSDAAEAVTVLGSGERIVGISDSVQKNTFYFPEVSKRTLIGKWNDPDWEKILSLCPDLVIAYKLVGNYTYDVWEAEKRLGP